MSQRINITVAAKVTGRQEKKIRSWLAETPSPLSIEWGHFRGGRRIGSQVKKGRTRLLDVAELKALHFARGGSAWNERYLPPPDLSVLLRERDELRAERDALRQRLHALEAELTQARMREAALASFPLPSAPPDLSALNSLTPALDDTLPPSSASFIGAAPLRPDRAPQGQRLADVVLTSERNQVPANDSDAPTRWEVASGAVSHLGASAPAASRSGAEREESMVSDFVGARTRADRPERLDRQRERNLDAATNVPAWARGRFTRLLWTNYWKMDAEQAENGWIQFPVWARMCGVAPETVGTHRRRALDGGFPRDRGFDFHRVDAGKTALRYVDAVQRRAWFDYWRTHGHIHHVPSEEEVQEALDEITGWYSHSGAMR